MSLCSFRVEEECLPLTLSLLPQSGGLLTKKCRNLKLQRSFCSVSLLRPAADQLTRIDDHVLMISVCCLSSFKPSAVFGLRASRRAAPWAAAAPWRRCRAGRPAPPCSSPCCSGSSGACSTFGTSGVCSDKNNRVHWREAADDKSFSLTEVTSDERQHN